MKLTKELDKIEQKNKHTHTHMQHEIMGVPE